MKFVLMGVLLATWIGCGALPDVAHEPVIRNPFPQLSRVAIAPFFNLSDEKTVDGRRFALAYYNELQSVQGFEVVPLTVVESAIRQHQIQLSYPGEARRLAQLLDVDAVVIGAVTDYSPYYPPRCGLQVEWYSANPCFHEIPAGYGLPWGTIEEEYIPEPLIYEAEMALAKAQLKTQTPHYEAQQLRPPAMKNPPELIPVPDQSDPETAGQEISFEEEVQPASANPKTATIAQTGESLPPDWPDPRGLIPPGPQCNAPACRKSNEPVMRHTRVYNGNDAQFTSALSNYEYFRDDARYGSWQAYLQRSEDFIRFCCHMHIAELLSARGGANQTRVVWRWSNDR